ncbi:MAG: hypothetical protein U0528_05320 [Anaerolineae bacterium]
MAEGALRPAFSVLLTVNAVSRRFNIPDFDNTLLLNFGDVIRLRGYEIHYDGVDPIKLGDPQIGISLAWQCIQPMTDDYTVFVHIVPPSGVNYDQIDQQPDRQKSRPVCRQ